MSTFSSEHRLPLRIAVKRYWPWLIGMGVAAVLIVLMPEMDQRSTAIALSLLLGACISGWPVLRYNAPYSFWVLACLLWFSVPLVYVAVTLSIDALRGGGVP